MKRRLKLRPPQSRDAETCGRRRAEPMSLSPRFASRLLAPPASVPRVECKGESCDSVRRAVVWGTDQPRARAGRTDIRTLALAHSQRRAVDLSSP
jgi:hypothetical protein